MTINTSSHGCIICSSDTSYYFSKNYPTYPNSPFPDGLKVDYWKCQHCGFVISETHKNMTPEKWSQLNMSWHHYFENNIDAKISNSPPYAEQALAMSMLSVNGIVDLNDALDYAAGYGTLSKFTKKYFNKEIKIFDRYVQSNDNELDYVEEKDLKKYQLVINSAMFEHVLNREGLDEVNNLVAADGVLMLHTVICEKIPADPDWFYLAPMVHTAFHTNKSMTILMQQWDYSSSIYCPHAKCWFLFKKDCSQLKNLENKVDEINKSIRTNYFHYKTGFMDYWKGF